MNAMELKAEDRLLVKVDEAARMISMGRAKAYQMAASGEMPGVIRIGKSVRVSVAALRDWVEHRHVNVHA